MSENKIDKQNMRAAERSGAGKKGAAGGWIVGILMVLTVWSLVKPDSSFSENENRYLAQRPEVSVESLLDGSFMEAYEDYITDQFPLRDGWIRLRTQVMRLFGRKEINDVYLGSDGYLLEAHLDVDNAAAYRNAGVLTTYLSKEETSAALASAAQEGTAETAGDESPAGRAHIAVIMAPTATAVLSDKLPAHAATWDQKSFIEDLGEQLEDGSEGLGNRIVYVDALGALESHADEPVYYRTDHHWTTRGAFYVYQAYAREMGWDVPQEEDYDVTGVSNDFLGTIYSKLGWAPQKDSIEEWDWKGAGASHLLIEENGEESDSLYFPAHLDTRDEYSYFLDGNHTIEVIDTADAPEGTLLLIKDSYAHCFVPFLTRNFRRIVMVDLRYLREPVSDVMSRYNVTDICVLYNTVHFSEANLGMLLLDR